LPSDFHESQVHIFTEKLKAYLDFNAAQDLRDCIAIKLIVLA